MKRDQELKGVEFKTLHSYVPERRRVLREVPAYSVRKTPNFYKG